MRFLQFADLLETTGADNRVDAIESYVVQSIRYLCTFSTFSLAPKNGSGNLSRILTW